MVVYGARVRKDFELGQLFLNYGLTALIVDLNAIQPAVKQVAPRLVDRELDRVAP